MYQLVLTNGEEYWISKETADIITKAVKDKEQFVEIKTMERFININSIHSYGLPNSILQMIGLASEFRLNEFGLYCKKGTFWYKWDKVRWKITKEDVESFASSVFRLKTQPEINPENSSKLDKIDTPESAVAAEKVEDKLIQK